MRLLITGGAASSAHPSFVLSQEGGRGTRGGQLEGRDAGGPRVRCRFVEVPLHGPFPVEGVELVVGDIMDEGMMMRPAGGRM